MRASPCLRCVYFSVYVLMSVTDMYACILSIGTFYCTFACVSMRAFVCVHEHVCVLDLECACACACVCVHVRACVCLCTCVSVCVCVALRDR